MEIKIKKLTMVKFMPLDRCGRVYLYCIQRTMKALDANWAQNN